MSYMRYSSRPQWEPTVKPLYVYSIHGTDDERGMRLHDTGLREREFIEVAMRMLAQSQQLDEEELEKAHAAFRHRMRLDSDYDSKEES